MSPARPRKKKVQEKPKILEGRMFCFERGFTVWPDDQGDRPVRVVVLTRDEAVRRGIVKPDPLLAEQRPD